MNRVIVFGRNKPADLNHLELYPFRSKFLEAAPVNVENVLNYPTSLITWYDQESSPMCVGFANSWVMSILNQGDGVIRAYNARWLYAQAQLVDGERRPHEGTTVRAAMDVLRKKGTCIE